MAAAAILNPWTLCDKPAGPDDLPQYSVASLERTHVLQIFEQCWETCDFHCRSEAMDASVTYKMNNSAASSILTSCFVRYTC